MGNSGNRPQRCVLCRGANPGNWAPNLQRKDYPPKPAISPFCQMCWDLYVHYYDDKRGDVMGCKVHVWGCYNGAQYNAIRGVRDEEVRWVVTCIKSGGGEKEREVDLNGAVVFPPRRDGQVAPADLDELLGRLRAEKDISSL